MLQVTTHPIQPHRIIQIQATQPQQTRQIQQQIWLTTQLHLLIALEMGGMGMYWGYSNQEELLPYLEVNLSLVRLMVQFC